MGLDQSRVAIQKKAFVWNPGCEKKVLHCGADNEAAATAERAHTGGRNTEIIVCAKRRGNNTENKVKHELDFVKRSGHHVWKTLVSDSGLSRILHKRRRVSEERGIWH